MTAFERIKELLLTGSTPEAEAELLGFLREHLEIEEEPEPAEVRLRALALVQTAAKFPEIKEAEKVVPLPRSHHRSWSNNAWQKYNDLVKGAPMETLVVDQCLAISTRKGYRPPPELLPMLAGMIDKHQLSPGFISLFKYYELDRVRSLFPLLAVFGHPLQGMKDENCSPKTKKQLLEYLSTAGDGELLQELESLWVDWNVDMKLVLLRHLPPDAFAERLPFLSDECCSSRSLRLQEQFLQKCLVADAGQVPERAGKALVGLIRDNKTDDEWEKEWGRLFENRAIELDPKSDRAIWILRRLHPGRYLDELGTAALPEELAGRKFPWMWLAALYEGAVRHGQSDLQKSLEDLWFDSPDRPLLEEFISSGAVAAFTRKKYDALCNRLLNHFPHLEYNRDFLYLVTTAEMSWGKDCGWAFMEALKNYVSEGEEITDELEDILAFAAHFLHPAFLDGLRRERRRLRTNDALGEELDKVIRVVALRKQFMAEIAK